MLSTPEPINILNLRLADRLGKFMDGSPKYRLVWSAGQLEKRYGTFEDWYGHIFVRRYVGVREVPKYPYAPNHWVMEKQIPIPAAHKDELFTQSFYSWEPVWIFRDGEGNPLPPVWEVIELLCKTIERGALHLTESDFVAEENARYLEDVKAAEEEIGAEQRSPLFAFEESAFMDSTKQKGWIR